MSPTRRSKASSATWAEGVAEDQASGSNSWPRAHAAAMKPAIGRLMPATAAKISAPWHSAGQPSACAKSA